MEDIFEGKDILVTGGCGSIGSEIVKQLAAFSPHRIRVFDNNESGHFHLNRKVTSSSIRNLIGDVRDRERVFRAMKGVDYVFHAAALKHVPFCEYNPFEAVYTNVIGTKHVVEAAIEQGVDKMIGISTDKSVNPINTMGASKLLSERIIINSPLGTSQSHFSCVRFGNVLNSVGSVIPLFRDQISKGGPVTLTSEDMTRFFMTIPQAVSLILESTRIMKGREIFVLKMQGFKIKDLAEIMIEELAPAHGFAPSEIPIEIIGMRPGEKLYEALFTDEERPYISQLDHMFVLRNSPYDTFQPNMEAQFDNYSSDTMDLLSKEAVRKMLYAEKILA